ncbi:MAG: UDP-N-acetylmuramate dehydrogenase [Caldisericaceae bacterium]
MITREIDVLRSSVKGEVLTNELMSKHTSFRIGGPAEVFVKPSSTDDLKKVLEWAKRNSQNIFVMGNGTNLIVSDDGIEGVVIKMADTFANIQYDGSEAMVESGTSMQYFLEESLRKGLGGMEFAWGIPGAVGGSIVMNAGSNSHFISTKINYVDVMDFNGRKLRLSHDDLKFDYRYSVLQEEPLILLNALFTLDKKDVAMMKVERESFIKSRWEKQPIDFPCAGSVFKNPPTTYAGKVLEEVGCKGMQVGGAKISEKHANFIVNLGNATASDVLSLIKEAQQRVYKQKDLILELEIKLVGNFQTSYLLERNK